MTGKPVYLDHNATSPLRPAARAAMRVAMEIDGNASSVHGFGRKARALLERSREDLARLYGAAPGQLAFTSGATEANNQALLLAAGEPLLVSAGEHDSVLQARPDAERIPLTGGGVIDLDWLAGRLQKGEPPKLVSVMLVNNETGVIQPVREVAALARAAGALTHCDAVQAAGRLPLSFAELGVDVMTLSAHKLGGPAGCGLLIQREGVSVPPLIRGGGQERRRRAGTENLIGIAGFAAAAAEAELERESAMQRLAAWREAFESAILEAAPEAIVYGRDAARVANCTCFGAPGLSAETQVMAMDLAGFAVSAGSACSSGKVTSSHVLLAMGAGDEEAGSAIRVSLGWTNEEGDLAAFKNAWLAYRARARQAA